eukprot:3416222-Rhodomonas_salina.1
MDRPPPSLPLCLCPVPNDYNQNKKTDTLWPVVREGTLPHSPAPNNTQKRNTQVLGKELTRGELNPARLQLLEKVEVASDPIALRHRRVREQSRRHRLCAPTDRCQAPGCRRAVVCCGGCFA